MKNQCRLWLVWFSGLSTGLQTKGLLVQFLVRVHAWVAGQIPSTGHMKGNHTLKIKISVEPECWAGCSRNHWVKLLSFIKEIKNGVSTTLPDTSQVKIINLLI